MCACVCRWGGWRAWNEKVIPRKWKLYSDVGENKIDFPQKGIHRFLFFALSLPFTVVAFAKSHAKKYCPIRDGAILSSRWSPSSAAVEERKIVFLSPQRFMTGIRIENCVTLPLDDDFSVEWVRCGDNMYGVLKDLCSSRGRLFYCWEYMCEIFSYYVAGKTFRPIQIFLRSWCSFFTAEDKLFLLHSPNENETFSIRINSDITIVQCCSQRWRGKSFILDKQITMFKETFPHTERVGGSGVESVEERKRLDMLEANFLEGLDGFS